MVTAYKVTPRGIVVDVVRRPRSAATFEPIQLAEPAEEKPRPERDRRVRSLVASLQTEARRAGR